MKRRNFILITFLGTAAIAIPSYLKFKYNKENSLKLPIQLSYIYSTEALSLLGKEYLKKFPDENSEEILLKLLLKDYTNNDIQLKIKEDYAADNTIVLDGWVLSKTEGRQCALFSISQTKLK